MNEKEEVVIRTGVKGGDDTGTFGGGAGETGPSRGGGTIGSGT